MSENLIHPSLTTIRTQFGKSYDTWLKVRNDIKSEPSSYGVPSTTLRDFDDSMVALNSFLNSDESALLFNPIAANVHVRNGHWSNVANNLTSHITSLQGNPGLWPNIVDQFYSFINPLPGCFFSGPNVSPDKQVNAQLTQKAARVDDLFKMADQLIAHSTNGKEKIDKLSEELSQKLAESEKLKIKIDDGLKGLEQYREGLNQKGLAEAFAKRATALKWPLVRWGAGFVISLLIIGCTTLFPAIIHSFKTGDVFSHTVVTNNSEEKANLQSQDSLKKPTDLLIETLIRILMSSPMIWMAWFCGRQFTTTRRIKEEYEFKEATAMAYYGYSQEAGVHEGLKSELLQGAIRNFNENPSDKMDRAKEKVSPWEDIIHEVVKKADPNVVNNFLDSIAKLKK